MAKYSTFNEVIEVIKTENLKEINLCSRSVIFSIVRSGRVPEVKSDVYHHLMELYYDIKEKYL